VLPELQLLTYGFVVLACDSSSRILQ